MNYEAERAMNQKRLRMDGEPGHGVVQGNGLPLNYMDNGHQIPYQPYAGAYNHYPPPEAFGAYGPPPPGGYAPQNLSYAPPAHQNYPHHQGFPPQQPQQLHMPQGHMVQGYGEMAMHKPAWPPQGHLLPPIDPHKPIDPKHLKPEIKLEPTDPQKRPHPENEVMGGDLEQPKIKIKTDIFKPDEQPRLEQEKPQEVMQNAASQLPNLAEPLKDNMQPTPEIAKDNNTDVSKPEPAKEGDVSRPAAPITPQTDKKEGEVKRESFSSPDRPSASSTPGLEPKKRGRPKGSTNKPKAPTPTKPLTPNMPTAPGAVRGPAAPAATGAAHNKPSPIGRPRGVGYQYAVRPFRKDFSGLTFRRRWSDDCLDSSHIPNEVYFGDVPVSTEILYNYYDANAEREKLAEAAARIAAQKAAAAKLAAAKLHARGIVTNEVTTVDSSSSETSASSDDSSDSDDDEPLKKSNTTKSPKDPGKKPSTPGTGKRGRPPVPPEQREPGIVDMKKFCSAAGIRFDYKKLVEGCTKNKERVAKMMELLVQAGLEGKPTLEKCQALKQAKIDKKEEGKKAKREAKVKSEPVESGSPSGRRMTRGATGVKPRQKILISSDSEDDTPSTRRTLSKLRDMCEDQSDSN